MNHMFIQRPNDVEILKLCVQTGYADKSQACTRMILIGRPHRPARTAIDSQKVTPNAENIGLFLHTFGQNGVDHQPSG